MKLTFLLAALALAAATGGCDKRGTPNPPTPQTQHDLAVVMEQTPASDPSLPMASQVLAAADAASAAGS